MGQNDQIWRCSVVGAFAALICLTADNLQAQAPAAVTYSVTVIRGTNAVYARSGAQTFDLLTTNIVLLVGDRVRIGPESQITLRQGDRSVLRYYENSYFEIVGPAGTNSARTRFRLLSGLLYFFHRGKPTDLEVLSRSSGAAARGTEFTFAVDPDGDTTTVAVLDGQVLLTNAFGNLPLGNGQRGVAVPGQPPALLPALDALNIIQWTLYYPGVLDPAELPLTADERVALSSSLAAYQSGDLLRALREYPIGRVPQSDAERIYRAALLLAMGKVDDAEPMLGAVGRTPAAPDRNSRLAAALEQLIAVVKQRSALPSAPPELATEWLVESYREQSLTRLEAALSAARNAIEKSSEFGFAWARAAELEFSFGRIDDSTRALGKALQFAPRNAQAIALNGFLYAAGNKIRSAIAEFDRAMNVDGGLANAWLGRGLSRIRSGDLEGGRQDLLTAAALEPQRAFLRSYLAKAWTDSGERKLAEHELDLAKQLDPGDPTAWLYSALLNQQYNQVNEAIRDLERSQDFSTNRAVYRSSFMLDQDRAVRSANLARIYGDAGMTDWSLLEAGRAASADYGNYSAHLFLANSYEQLRDPNRISLRYETAAVSEYLIANLVAPVGAGTLSPTISQAEYSKLFERNRLGLVSSTEYLSRGAWRQSAAQFGIFANTSYSLEALYRIDPGQRRNNDFEERQLGINVKQQITPADSIYLNALHYESEGGDRFQYYNPLDASTGLRTKETQEPAVIVGYHHQWRPGSHFLLAAAHYDDTYETSDSRTPFYRTQVINGELWGVFRRVADASIQTSTRIDSIEAQQFFHSPERTTIIGSRFQWGDFDVEMERFNILDDFRQNNPPEPPSLSSGFARFSLYGYHIWQPVDSLSLSAGLSYDLLRRPDNTRSVPVSNTESVIERVYPKVGFIWAPLDGTTLRGAYTRSLGGVSLDQSIRLEPTQVAGFNQAFRSIIPESLVGSNPGATFETYNLSFEQRFGRDFYLSLGGTLMYSEVSRQNGAYILNSGFGNQVNVLLGDVQERIKYREKSFRLTLDKLLGNEWSIGGRYELTQARFSNRFPAARPDANVSTTTQSVESFLHQVDLHAIYNHPSGFFSQIHALYTSQNNIGYGGSRPGDSFWQLDLFAGYRFARRRVEITVGVLNLTDTDYNLNPLIPYIEMPRERTLVTKLDLAF